MAKRSSAISNPEVSIRVQDSSESSDWLEVRTWRVSSNKDWKPLRSKGPAFEDRLKNRAAGLEQSMDKVRDISLSLSFGASQVDFALDFGCTDGAAASQLSQGIQGLL